VRTHVSLVRTLRSYVELHLLDLIGNMNAFDPKLIEGEDPYGSDDIIEATLCINGQDLTLHIEGSDQDDKTKPNGLLGVRHEQTGGMVRGPIDSSTWASIENFIRFVSK